LIPDILLAGIGNTISGVPGREPGLRLLGMPLGGEGLWLGRVPEETNGLFCIISGMVPGETNGLFCIIS
jgi:hypothetical protein